MDGPRLARPRENVEQTLVAQVEQGWELLKREGQANSDLWYDEYKRWRNYTADVLLSSYSNTRPHDEFLAAGEQASIAMSTIGQRSRNLRDAVNVLESLIDRLDFADDPVEAATATPTEYSREVFVVHGHDEGLRDTVARLLARLNFKPIILAEQPNQGRTLIEKFEANALDVGFAIVILTPDDYGRGRDDADFPAEPNRARQNVILELGYFMGKLTRSRVAALYEPGTELPSDIHGIAFVPIDAGGAWRFQVAGELAAAGYDVDLNRLK